jgi:deoxyribonuclease-1
MGYFIGLVVCLSLVTSTSFAFENPIWGSNYYMGDGGYAGQFETLGKTTDIHDALFEATARNHQVLGYTRARQVLLGRVYLESTGGEYSIRDVYCLKQFTQQDFGKRAAMGPEQIPDNTVLNTEHTWPQSRFTGMFPNEMQKSDLHHLFPSDSEMNSTRGNHKFAELAGPTEQIKCAASRFAHTAIGYRFEPPMEHRGNVARALFYFSIRYKIRIDNDEEGFLRKWHAEDPVDQAEVHHHELISQAQGNRNPFIDQPELINQIADF